MSGVEQIPSTCRLKAYDSTNAVWVSLAVSQSGEVKTADGTYLYTLGTIMATQSSGGIRLGSGVVERVVITVPQCIDASGVIYGELSGFTNHGVWIGGKSGNAPYSASGNFSGAKGLWVQAGEQKELYVQNLNEVYVCGDPSGWPVTYIGEVI